MVVLFKVTNTECVKNTTERLRVWPEAPVCISFRRTLELYVVATETAVPATLTAAAQRWHYEVVVAGFW